MHMAQLMPLPLTVSCFSKIQIGFTFLVPAYLGSPGKRAVKRVCVWISGISNDSKYSIALVQTHTHTHLVPDRQPHQHPTTLFFTGRMPSCHPTNSVKALTAPRGLFHQHHCRNRAWTTKQKFYQIRVKFRNINVRKGCLPYMVVAKFSGSAGRLIVG